DQFALLELGQSVLPRRSAGRRSHGQCERERRPRVGKGLLGELPRRIPGASDPARGRRLLDGFVLLSIGFNRSESERAPAGLWRAVIASGLYHGVNPGMGWPLAVSAGLMAK